MRLHQIVLKDIRRRKKRVFYTSFGVVIGITTLVAILTVAFAGQLKIYEELNKYGPNLVVTPAINDVGMKAGDLNLVNVVVGENYIEESKIPAIRGITDTMIKESLEIDYDGPLATLAPKLYVNTDIKGTNAILVGISPEDEFILRGWWVVEDGTYQENNNEIVVGTRHLSGENDVIVGSQAASLLALAPGDEIQIGSEQGTITGILKETGSTDDYWLFAPIKTVQKGYDKEGRVSALEIRALCQSCPVEFIANELNQEIPGIRAVAVQQIAKNEMSTMERLNRFMLALAVVTLFVGSLGVVNTMLTTVHERTKDIGIMKAVGASSYQVITIFIYEAIIVGFIGGVIGYALGTGAAYMLGPLIFQGVTVSPIIDYLPLSIGIAVGVTIAASVYPSYRASKIKVADSFRSL